MPEIRYDVIELKAAISPEGWIKDKPVVTRAGIFMYRQPNGKTIKEFRPEAEVFHADSLNSLFGIPMTDGHRGIITKSNASGIIGTVLSPGEKVNNDVAAEVIVHDPSKLGAKRELSLGYTCDTDDTPGEWKGEKYDSIQKNIRYNHLAVVTKGRAGNAKLRLDHDDAASFPFDPIEDTPMPDPTVKLVTIRLDGIDYQASPEVNNALAKAQTDMVALQKRFDGLEAERDQLKTKLTDADKTIADVKAGARSELQARMALETIATTHKIKFDEGDDDKSLKVKVLGKLRPELKLDGKSDDYIDSAFDMAMDYEGQKNRKVSDQRHKFDSTSHSRTDTDDRPAAVTAREQMLARIRGEKPDDKSAAA